MEIEEFVELLNKKMAELTKENEEVIISVKGDDYEDGEVTFLFNCAIFSIVQDLRRNDKSYGIVVEDPTGRGGYSDISIVTVRGNNVNKLIEIEHENKPHNKDKKEKNKTKLERCIENLRDSEARYKLLITYVYSGEKKLKEEICKYVDNNFQEGEILYLLHSPWNEEFNYQLEPFCSGR